ncbi:hypothetical protein BC828DRAFT_402055 [Blastocladiella britannica]|nr:hypothetical protein BC828DRAFT_402055 [Blastocladiella britannica]
MKRGNDGPLVPPPQEDASKRARFVATTASSSPVSSSPVPDDRVATATKLFQSLATTLTFLAVRNVHEVAYEKLAGSSRASTTAAPSPWTLPRLRDLLAIGRDLVTAGYVDPTDRDARARRVPGSVADVPMDDIPSSSSLSISSVPQHRSPNAVLVISLLHRNEHNMVSITASSSSLGRGSAGSRGAAAAAAANRVKAMTAAVERKVAAFRAAASAVVAKCKRESLDLDDHLNTLTAAILPDQSRESTPPELPSKYRIPTAPPTANPSDDAAPPDVHALLQESDGVQAEPFYRGQIVASIATEARAAITVPATEVLSPRVAEGIKAARGVTDLYEHQARALRVLLPPQQSNTVEQPQHVVITTTTASGKSLVYQSAAMMAMEAHRGPAVAAPRVLYIAPTKALAHDQLRSWRAVAGACLDWVQVDTLDGDTPPETRKRLRESAHVLLTNPDMLHVTVLPMHREWTEVIRHLRYVVVDEMHQYRGVFGSHCGWIFRRLLRVAAMYGNRSVQFIACSATIGNPLEHAQRLFYYTPVLVDSDTSPSPSRLTVVWNPSAPPQSTNAVAATPGRSKGTPATPDAARLFVYLVRRHVRVLAFTKTRTACELLFKEITTVLGGDLHGRVMAYRAGYHVDERRRIERGLTSGELIGVVATNALEVGIDIGSIDVVLHVGYPGSAALKQQAGRAGRRDRSSASILITDTAPLDQHLARHPEKVLNPPCEQTVVTDPTSVPVAATQLPCAAYEVPIDPHTEEYLPAIEGGWLACAAEKLTENRTTELLESTVSWPSRNVSIRALQSDEFMVVDRTRLDAQKVLEYVSGDRVGYSIYVGGIFLHQGKSYLITEVMPDRMLAHVRQTTANYYTAVRAFSEVDPIQELDQRVLECGQHLTHGTVQVTHFVTGFHKLHVTTRAVLDTVDMATPPFKRTTKGTYVDLSPTTVRALDALPIDGAALEMSNAHAAIHSVNHLLMNVLPMAVAGATAEDPDVGCECRTAAAMGHDRPYRVLMYDRTAGGLGHARRAFQQFSTLLETARSVVGECPCEGGCVECIVWKGCTGDNDQVFKAGAVALLDALLLKVIDVGVQAADP